LSPERSSAKIILAKRSRRHFVNGYDRQAWAEIQDWRNRQPRVRLGQFMPDAVRDGAQRVVRKSVDTLRQIPGAEQFQQALYAVLQGLLRTLMDVGAASVPRSTAVRRLKKKDYEVERFENIRALALQPCDTAFPRGKRFAYIGGSLAQGAVAGVVATVGDVEAFVGGGLTVSAGGVGAAPGATQVIAAMVGDMAGLLLGASRLTAETGAAYGYDPTDPKEKIFVAGVLGLATAGTEAAK
jgi:hypothetical protein